MDGSHTDCGAADQKLPRMRWGFVHWDAELNISFLPFFSFYPCAVHGGHHFCPCIWTHLTLWVFFPFLREKWKPNLLMNHHTSLPSEALNQYVCCFLIKRIAISFIITWWHRLTGTIKSCLGLQYLCTNKSAAHPYNLGKSCKREREKKTWEQCVITYAGINKCLSCLGHD